MNNEKERIWSISLYNKGDMKVMRKELLTPIEYHTGLSYEELQRIKNESEEAGYYVETNIVRRYYEVPVDKMTNADKVKAIAERLHLFGVTIYPEFGSFVLGLSSGFRNGSKNHLYLYSIGMSDLLFCPVDKENKGRDGELQPDYDNIWELPIKDFSNTFLYSVFMTLKAECKKSLTFEAYAQVLHEVGELPEIEK